MIVTRNRIAASDIAGAGQGLILEEDVATGQIVGAPELSAQLFASARWFVDRFTVSRDWPDECYINHSFEPTGLWHLGFVFALAALPAGTELTVDYRHQLPPGQAEDFIDAATGEKIVGYDWAQSLASSTRALSRLLK